MNNRSTLRKYVEGLWANELRSIGQSFQNFHTRLTYVLSELANMSTALSGFIGLDGLTKAESTIIRHGNYSDTTLQIDVTDGLTHEYTLTSTNVSLLSDDLPDTIQSSRITLYLNTPDASSCTVTLDTNLTIDAGSDGLCILGGQKYRYTILVYRPNSDTGDIIGTVRTELLS